MVGTRLALQEYIPKGRRQLQGGGGASDLIRDNEDLPLRPSQLQDAGGEVTAARTVEPLRADEARPAGVQARGNALGGELSADNGRQVLRADVDGTRVSSEVGDFPTSFTAPIPRAPPALRLHVPRGKPRARTAKASAR